MILKASGTDKTYGVHFLHRRTAKGHWQTVATVHPGACLTRERPCLTTPATVGIANCSPKDNFTRAVGRKLAFARAISGIPREERRGLWEGYFRYLKIVPRGGKHEGE